MVVADAPPSASGRESNTKCDDGFGSRPRHVGRPDEPRDCCILKLYAAAAVLGAFLASKEHAALSWHMRGFGPRGSKQKAKGERTKHDFARLRERRVGRAPQPIVPLSAKVKPSLA